MPPPPPLPPQSSSLSTFLFSPSSCIILHVLSSLLLYCTIIRGKGFRGHYIHSLPYFPEHNTTILHHKVTDTGSINKSFFTVCNPLPSSSFLFPSHLLGMWGWEKIGACFIKSAAFVVLRSYTNIALILHFMHCNIYYMVLCHRVWIASRRRIWTINM